MVADWHVLTTALDKAAEIPGNSREMFLDWLGAGLDPDRSVLFVQSSIKEHAELFLLLCMLISMGRLERNPTFKEQVRDLEPRRRDQLRPPRLPGAAGRRHPRLPRARRARWARTSCRTSN